LNRLADFRRIFDNAALQTSERCFFDFVPGRAMTAIAVAVLERVAVVAHE